MGQKIVSEVSSFQRLKFMQEWGGKNVLFREVVPKPNKPSLPEHNIANCTHFSCYNALNATKTSRNRNHQFSKTVYSANEYQT